MSRKTTIFPVIVACVALAGCTQKSQPDYVANIEVPNGDPVWSESTETTCVTGCRCPIRPTRDAVTIDVSLDSDLSILVSAEIGRAKGWMTYVEDPKRLIFAKTVARRFPSPTDAATQMPAVVTGVLPPSVPHSTRCGYFSADQSLLFRDVMQLYRSASESGLREVVWLVAEAEL